MAYILRPFRGEDAGALAELFLCAIREIAAHSYSSEQIEAWAAQHPQAEAFSARSAAGDHIQVAVDHDNRPVAYALLEQPRKGIAHLDMLYCHPDHTRMGLANRLLAHSEAAAKAMGAATMITEASETARPVFERAGYEVTRRKDFQIALKDRAIAIHNYAMEKSLIR